MGNFFKFSERGTNLRTEVVAGLTTFMTMAYIIFVNPSILGTEGTGLSVPGVFFATCIAAAAASIAMGLVANFPVALASGLGLNAVVAFTLILGLQLPWQTAMAAVIVEGLLVTIFVLTNLREAIMNAIPLGLKFAIAVGIGLFIAFIGLKNAGIVVADPVTYLRLGEFTQGPVLLALPFSPLISVIGGSVPIPNPEGGQDILVSPVTAPALIVVGFLMMTAVRLIPWEEADEAIPAFLTILTLPLTFNISYGIGFGFISYVLIKLARGKPGEVHPLLYVVALLFALAFLVPE